MPRKIRRACSARPPCRSCKTGWGVGSSRPEGKIGSERDRTDTRDLGEKRVKSRRSVATLQGQRQSDLGWSSHCRGEGGDGGAGTRPLGPISRDRWVVSPSLRWRLTGTRCGELEMRARQAKWTCGACSRRCGRVGGARDRDQEESVTRRAEEAETELGPAG